MRRESGFATDKVSRPAGGLLQGETLKVVNMLDLARELSGDTAPEPTQGSTTEQAISPGDFWKKRLANWSSSTPVAVTLPPPPAGERNSWCSIPLPERLMTLLKRGSDQHSVPLPTYFAGAWALLCQRYCGADDVLFGMVKSLVEREDSPDQPVPHIVPVRATFKEDARAGQWLRMLAEQSREAAPFEFSSLSQIRAAAGVPENAVLFHSVLSIGNHSFDPMSVVQGEQPAAERYDIAAAVYLGSEPSLRIAFSGQRYSHRAIELMLGHWLMLLEGFATLPDELLTALPMTTSAEREQLLQDWNATTDPYPDTLVIPQLFEAQVERTPDAVAVAFGPRSLSYAELNHKANALAHWLRDHGIGADSVVGICMDRCIEMVVAALGVLKAGAAYLPLDPGYPHDRLQFMLDDARVRVLLTQPELTSIFPQPPECVVHLNEAWLDSIPPRTENPAPNTTPESLAYLIYTSGSTGKPKGVAMIHRPLVNLIDWQVKNSPLGVGDKTLQFTSLSFDVSFQEIFSTWASGGTLVLITADLRLSPRDLWQFIVRENIARIFLPFVALQQLAESAAAEQTNAPALRELITAGEQLQVTPRLRELFKRHPDATLHNHYGPSETHVVTALRLNGAPDAWPALPSIGRAIQNASMFILDKHFHPVPVGLPGELYIGGVALARGYFERADITEARFIKNPFDGNKSRLYRTGDLTRYLPDGNIEFLGRIDHQVKIRGYRVELGEVEAALNKLPGVRECVVTARDREGIKQLVAHVVPHRGTTVNTQALRAELKQQLPEYMVPSAIVFLEKLPLTPSGKVDRRALPAPDEVQSAPTPASPADTPWLPIQLQLVEIWQELLQVRPIGIRDNFFELGGHSILAVKMMDRVEQLTGKKLPVTELFNDATIAHLSELILQSREQSATTVVELTSSGTRPPLYFLHGDIIGGGFYARDLARLLGPEQPFYVLPPAGMADGALATVEEMTTIHLRDLRAHRPHGPYILAGFCVGALIAYHMAVRLRAEGESVPWVALIDPQLASRPLRAHYRAVRRAAAKKGYSDEQKLAAFARGHKILYRLRELWQAPLGEKARFALNKARRLVGGANGTANVEPAHAEQANGAPENTNDLFGNSEQRVLAAFNWIISAYTPPRFDGQASVFLTDEQLEITPFLERRWRDVIPQLAVERIPGSHLGAITTDVGLLASEVDSHLRRVLALEGAQPGHAQKAPARALSH